MTQAASRPKPAQSADTSFFWEGAARGELLIQRRPEPTDPAAAARRVTRALTDGVVEASDGTWLTIPFDSVCVHSDAPNSPEVAAAVRSALDTL